MTDRRTIVRGCDIAWERFGNGTDVVWGHGLTQSRALEDRRPIVKWTAIDARVLRYDARGHGESASTLDLDGYRWSGLARDQLALASRLGIDHYIAAGASMGAATALHAAVLAPERIRALVLVIPPTGWETRAEQAGTYEVGATIIETRGVETVIAAGAQVAPPDPFLDDSDYRDVRADGLRSWDPERLARVMRGAARAQLPSRDDIASITCPTLVLAWTGDPVHPTSTVDELARLIPTADLTVASTATDLATWSHRVGEFIGALSRPG